MSDTENRKQLNTLLEGPPEWSSLTCVSYMDDEMKAAGVAYDAAAQRADVRGIE